MSNAFKHELDSLSKHYDALGKQHGYSPDATQQSSIETQERRLAVLLDMIANCQTAKILDFGCGTGHLYQMLQRRGFVGEYVGYDISTQLLDIAKQHYPAARFEHKNIFEQPMAEIFDWVVISGVFNNDIGCNQAFMQQVLTKLFAHVKQGLVFNALSRYVDYQSPGLYYFDPGWVFDFCKQNLTTHVMLNHGYQIKPDVIPFEFSCCCYKTEFQPVKPYG